MKCRICKSEYEPGAGDKGRCPGCESKAERADARIRDLYPPEHTPPLFTDERERERAKGTLWE